MRRADKAITDRAELDEIIRDSQICRVAFAVDNQPYLVPLCFGYDGSALYFHTARRGKKIDCLERNPRVCVEFERNVRLVTDKADPCKWTFAFESVIADGVVEELCSGEDKERGSLTGRGT